MLQDWMTTLGSRARARKEYVPATREISRTQVVEQFAHLVISMCNKEFTKCPEPASLETCMLLDRIIFAELNGFMETAPKK
jgi:hypothetical protein